MSPQLEFAVIVMSPILACLAIASCIMVHDLWQISRDTAAGRAIRGSFNRRHPRYPLP